MAKHVGGASASRHGATDEIAAVIGDALRRAGLRVTVSSPDRVATLDGCDAVILGSAVYIGRWLEPARRFIERHQAALACRPVWLFSSGPIGDPPRPQEDPAEVGALLAATRARAHRVFPGKLDRRALGGGEKLVASAVRAPEGDYRPWPEIDAWAESIARALREPALAATPA